MSEKPMNTFLPAPAGTYAVFDARDSAERKAAVPVYVRLEPVISWKITEDEETGEHGAAPVYLHMRAGCWRSEFGFLLPDGRIQSLSFGDATSLEDLVEAIRRKQAEQTTRLQVVGGAR